MRIESYKNLIVWQRSINLVFEIYKLSKKFPANEQYALTSQMRRAAISIPSNIAEGYRRQGLGEYIQFLSISYASAAELETQLIIAGKIYPDVDYSKADAFLNEVLRMLSSMIGKLKTKR